MRHILLLTFFAALGFAVNGQTLTANAGPDVCWTSLPAAPGMPDTPRIGGAPVAIGGTAPYMYQWNVLGSGPAFPLLDSPTIARPKLNIRLGGPGGNDSLDFLLTVVDANGLSGRDTVRVYYATLGCVLQTCSFNIQPGDTVSLFNPCTTTGFAPITARWQPAEFISDTTAAQPRVWTPVSRNYASTFRDRAGCVWHGECQIIVQAASVNDPLRGNGLSIAPNPVNGRSVVTVPKSALGAGYRVLSSQGAVVLEGNVRTEKITLEEAGHWAPGVYLFQLIQEGKAPRSLRFEAR